MKKPRRAGPPEGPGDERTTQDAPHVKLTKEDIRKLVEVFLILDRWKREDDQRAVAERAR